jgi:hypothetical protein
MKVYHHNDEMSEVSRECHWLVSEHDPAHRYHDFRSHPELIPEVLEDFRPFSHQKAVHEFYDLVRNLNGPQSPFETNDCAFKGPHENTSRNASTRSSVASGRLMIFFRELQLNTQIAYIEWLRDGVHFYISALTSELEEGVVGTSIMKMHITELGTASNPAAGHELALHFWAWGDTDDEVFANLYTVINDIHRTFYALSADVFEKRYVAAAPSNNSE